MLRVALLSCLAVALLVTLSCGQEPDVLNISLPHLKASSDESISSLEIQVNAGTVESMINIPIGWQVTIDNDANWVTRIKARSTVGAATLSADELKRLIFSVRRNEGPGFKFDVSGTVALSKTFGSRKLAVGISDFNLH